MSTQTERPILMSAPMVRAILAGTKTQTRRVVKQHKAFEEWGVKGPDDAYDATTDDDGQGFFLVAGDHGYAGPVPCPYGQPGDRLWVREAWGFRARISTTGTPNDQVKIAYAADDATRFFDRPAGDWSGLPNQRDQKEGESHDDYYGKYLHAWWKQWRPSIHMPRWASRITLEIVGVRVERLNEISDDDAADEGIEYLSTPTGGDDYMTFWRDYSRTHEQADGHPFFDDGHERDSFRTLWESINGPGSWAANPWVWVVEFRRLP